MPRNKPSTKHAFGAKKRVKARGRAGGRKPSKNAADDNGSQGTSTGIAESYNASIDLAANSNPSIFDSIEHETALARKQRYFETCNDANTKLCPGYRIVSISAMKQLVESLACPKCFQQELLLEEQRKGKSDFSVFCKVCDGKVTKVNSDESVTNGTSNINLLTTFSAVNNGIGYSKLCSFFSGQNLPMPMTLKTYQQLHLKINSAVDLVTEQHFQNVASIIKQEYRQIDQTEDDNVINIAVSYDGSWHKRGHSSLFGVGAVIDLLTGLVIDICVMSKYCHGCALAKTNQTRYANHQCQVNYDGSSAAMEVEAALQLFQRSVEKYGLRYLTMLSDGDSKTFLKLKEKNIYGDAFPISKEECINHVAKRMGSGLRKLKESSKQSGKNLGGKGRLTNEKIEKIQNYYGRSLKDNAPNVESMRNATYASLFHMVSTDDEPHHTFCPTGAESWCHYNRAAVDPKQKKPHRPTLPKDIGEMLLPLYKRLTDTELLQRCTRNRTQNNNESLHSIIWQKCPKGVFASYNTVKTAAALASMQFNKGSKALFDVLLQLDLPLGVYQTEAVAKTVKRKFSDATRASSSDAKLQRKQRKIKKLKLQDKHEAAEGTVYEAGGF